MCWSNTLRAIPTTSCGSEYGASDVGAKDLVYYGPSISHKESHKPRIWFQRAVFQEWEGIGVWDERNFPIKLLDKKIWHVAHHQA